MLSPRHDVPNGYDHQFHLRLSDIRRNNHRLTAPINSQTETADVRKSAALGTDMDRRRCEQRPGWVDARIILIVMMCSKHKYEATFIFPAQLCSHQTESS
jgi:hypothetical protein